MTEDEARRVLLVQAHEAGGATPLWTDDDRTWATRAARQDLGEGGPFEVFVAERARHAMQRLLPRDAAARRWVQPRLPYAALMAGAVLLAFGLGVAADHLGAGQRIDLMAPPVWAVIAWNLVIYGALLLPTRRRRLFQGLASLHRSELPDTVAAAWLRQAAPLQRARLSLLLHGAAAALAIGLIAGLYLRGLVQDWRAGWQSTFLEAPLVQALLDTALAPASTLSGIAVPAVEPLRITPGVAPQGAAAPWIHLYAVTLLLAVIGPRLLLAAWAAWRARALSRHFPLALDGPYFDRLRLQHSGGRVVADVRPHGQPLSARAALGLRALLAARWGDAIDLRIADAVPYGDEEKAAATPAPAGAGLRIATFDLGATPEEETHGRLLDALNGAVPRLAVVDEAAFRRRFASVPQRLDERRAAWQRLARAHGAGLVCADLDGEAPADAAQQLKAALG
jgi:hypothetical protein